mmetsp:Transcript_12233/g.33935  ORF Transcript_12233/g.33935 Transcript_12233/m.33935 type:complete len:356 (+) Transcript_12233:241-1308(+)
MGAEESNPSVFPEVEQAPTRVATFNEEGNTIRFADNNDELYDEREIAKQSPTSFRLSKLQGKLKGEGHINMRVTTAQQAQRQVQEAQGVDSLEARVLRVIHHKRTQIGLASLLVLDIIILFTELALLTLYPACQLIRRDGISCCPAQDDAHEHFLRSLAASSGDDSHDDHHYCEQEGTVALFDYEAGCDEHKWHTVHRAEEFMYGLTMTILFVFWIELLILIWALKPKVFFRQFFFVSDLVIVTVSIALELTFKFMDDDTLTAMVGLLILGRVWRFVRIGHGIVEVTADAAREKYEVLVDYTSDLELLLKKHNIPLPEDQTSATAQEMCKSMKVSMKNSKTLEEGEGPTIVHVDD